MNLIELRSLVIGENDRATFIIFFTRGYYETHPDITAGTDPTQTMADLHADSIHITDGTPEGIALVMDMGLKEVWTYIVAGIKSYLAEEN